MRLLCNDAAKKKLVCPKKNCTQVITTNMNEGGSTSKVYWSAVIIWFPLTNVLHRSMTSHVLYKSCLCTIRFSKDQVPLEDYPLPYLVDRLPTTENFASNLEVDNL